MGLVGNSVIRLVDFDLGGFSHEDFGLAVEVDFLLKLKGFGIDFLLGPDNITLYFRPGFGSSNMSFQC